MTGSSDSAETVAAEWDQRYAAWASSLPEGEPNAVLVDAAAGLKPGRALDIGCGVGAEAIWLAERGWTVTGLDVSQIALDAAAARARRAGVAVHWLQGTLDSADLAPGGFDLVCAHYPALRHSPGRDAQRALLAAVASGGTLLVVHHADVDVEKAKSYGFDPADYLSHEDVVGLLGPEWDVRIDSRRPRTKPAGPEGQHTHDDVVRAVRLR
ncbi:class I SAM-dependent methyltransferase [Mycolicibacterium palauense]|uniref:class I SAM-dependent methyltransferase n=1 Tax=Mycolicibacterium palauense TaxID=2034511 RepID=UPI000BFED5B5|nr:class I SAM-dependent methyltransferase [Mycolicibacterium palauense]